MKNFIFCKRSRKLIADYLLVTKRSLRQFLAGQLNLRKYQQQVSAALAPLEIRVTHSGIKPRAEEFFRLLILGESKGVNKAERKTERRRINVSPQRVEGYCFLILFREEDSPPPTKSRGVRLLKEYSHERSRKEEKKVRKRKRVKKKKEKLGEEGEKSGTQNSESGTLPFFPCYLLYYTSARAPRTPAFLIP